MTLRETLFTVCLIILILCLSAGFMFTGQWIGVLAACITGLVWYLAKKNPASWLPHFCLLASVCQAVIGTLTGFPHLLALFSSGIALAVWDLLFLNADLGINPSEAQTRQFEYKHIQSLALAVGLGSAAGGLGRLLHLEPRFSC